MPVFSGLVPASYATGWATVQLASSGRSQVNFSGSNGSHPVGSLLADASGNLFGTTSEGGASGNGTVFEIANTASGYASTSTILVSFNGTNGSQPAGNLISDATGDLFGTTVAGGASGKGTVFEIPKTATGYASIPTTLASFSGANGGTLWGSLIADATGNLFGTTSSGGANNGGTAFEIVQDCHRLRQHTHHPSQLQRRRRQW